MQFPRDRDELIARTESGESFEFFFFYGHKPPPQGVDASCLSQWFACDFEVDGVRYPTAEHWMMAAKARLFHDEAMLAQILLAPDPKTAKSLGRRVANFDGQVWNEKRVGLVTQGNLAKFGQNQELAAFLQTTRGRIIVEAAGRDVLWGIGLGAANPRAQDPRTWRGRNLLGFVLTDVREQLS